MIGQWVERKLDTVVSIGVQKGTLEEHLSKLTTIDQEVFKKYSFILY